jgi:hypothetical protein
MLTISITKNEITPASHALKKIGGEEKSTPPSERLRVGPDTRLPERSGPIAVSRDPNLTATFPRKIPPASIFSAFPMPAKRAAVRNGLTDAQLLRRIQQLADLTPQLLSKIDHPPLESLLIEVTTRAVISGITSALLAPRRNFQASAAPLHAAGGKRCGNAWIPAWKECRQGFSPEARKMIERYKKGISISSPTGRTVEFGPKLAAHIEKDWSGRDPQRTAFLSQAEAAVQSPPEVWQNGTFVRYFKKNAPP